MSRHRAQTRRRDFVACRLGQASVPCTDVRPNFWRPRKKCWVALNGLFAYGRGVRPMGLTPLLTVIFIAPQIIQGRTCHAVKI
jgi:hypothetical protein